MNSRSGFTAEPSTGARVYFGTYTRGTESEGIYVAELDVEAGKLANLRVAAKCVNPSFVTLHPQSPYLYAVSEISDYDGTSAGAVMAFKVNPEDGSLTKLNEQSSRGGAPCHLVVDRSGKFVLTANYTGGSVCVHPIDAEGKLGKLTSFVQHQGKSVHERRQEAPHAHSVHVDPANRFALVADLGLDQILSYHFDAEHGLLAANPGGAARQTPGAGPRHFAFHPSGRLAFANNELDSTVTAFRYDAERGSLTPVHSVSTLPAGGSPGNSTAECQVHPQGKFVYVSNRGHDSIAIFAVDPETGKLTPAGHTPTQGKTPRNFAIDPTGRVLLAENQGSNQVVVFRIDSQTGQLTPTGHTLAVPAPVCAKFR